MTSTGMDVDADDIAADAALVAAARRRVRRMLVADRGSGLLAGGSFLVAAAECVFRLVHHFVGTHALDELSVHAPYYALFVVGPIANVIEIARTSAKKPAPSPVTG